MRVLWHKESMPNHLFETKYNFKKNSNGTGSLNSKLH